MNAHRGQQLFIRCVALMLGGVACIALVASIQVFSSVATAEATARTQLRATSVRIAGAADAVQTVSDSIANGSATVTNVQSSVKNTAGIVRSAAMTTGDIGNSLGFNIPLTRFRPLGQAEDTLQNQTTQIIALADSLDRTAASLGTNSADLRLVAADIASIATILRWVASTEGQLAGDSKTAGGLTRIADGLRWACASAMIVSLIVLGVAAALWMLARQRPSLDAIADAVVARMEAQRPGEKAETAFSVSPTVAASEPSA